MKRAQEQQAEVFQTLMSNGRYAYFDSLIVDAKNNVPGAQETLNIGNSAISEAINSLQINNANPKDGEQGARIKTAMAFLKNAADFERSKEIAFFNYYKKELPEKLQIMLNTPDNFNYISFITSINQAIKTSKTFQKILKREIERIESRNQAERTTIFNGKRNIQLIEGHNRDEFYLQYDSQKIFHGLVENRSFMSQITNFIIENSGAQLFTIQDHFKLNERKFASLLTLVTQKCLEFLAINLTSNKNFNLDNATLAEAFPRFSQQLSLELESLLQDLNENENLDNALTSVADQYGITEETMQKVNISNQQINTVKRRLEKAYDQFSKMQNQPLKLKDKLNIEQLVRASNAVSAIGYYTGEDISLTTWLRNNFSAILGGRSNPTDDIQMGYLVTNFSYNDNWLKDLSHKLANAQNEAYREQIQTISDVTSFKHNTEVLKSAREQQRKILQQEVEKLQLQDQNFADLIRHFNIHSTIKGYFSAGDTKGYFAKDGGFGGASFGSNLVNEINIVNDVITASGAEPLSEKEIEFLTFSAMNAGQHLLGAKNKTTLEDYFSTFAGLLMFNDAALMAEDIAHIHEHLATSTVTDLHMYELNGIIVPTSFILTSTYQALSGAASQILGATEKAAIRAKLETYNKTYKRNSEPESLSMTVLNATKFHIYFLAGFLDILKSIQKSLS